MSAATPLRALHQPPLIGLLLALTIVFGPALQLTSSGVAGETSGSSLRASAPLLFDGGKRLAPQAGTEITSKPGLLAQAATGLRPPRRLTPAGSLLRDPLPATPAWLLWQRLLLDGG